MSKWIEYSFAINNKQGPSFANQVNVDEQQEDNKPPTDFHLAKHKLIFHHPSSLLLKDSMIRNILSTTKIALTINILHENSL